MIVMSMSIVVAVIAGVGLCILMSAGNGQMMEDDLIVEAEQRGITVLVRMTSVQATGKYLENMISFAQACADENIRKPLIQLKRGSEHPPNVKVFAEWNDVCEQIGHLLPELSDRLTLFDIKTPLFGAVAHVSIRNDHPIVKIHVGVPSGSIV